MSELQIDPRRSALVVIDLQKGIVQMPTAPYRAEEVIERTVQLAQACRQIGAFVVLVHVGPSADGRDMLRPVADDSMAMGKWPEGFDEIIPEIGPEPGDHVLRKRQWGAFYGTDLDLQLRRRGIDTIMLCGIATNFGVESTARDAYERGYSQIIVEDACTSRSAEAHRFAVQNILNRIARIRTTEDVLTALQQK